MHGSRGTRTLLKGYILLPRPHVIVHIKQQSYDVYYIEVEEGHDHHEVRPGADAALLDVDSLAAAWVSQWRGEEMGLPLEPRQTVLILIHLLNHCSAKHCPELASHWSGSAQVSWFDSCSQTSQPRADTRLHSGSGADSGHSFIQIGPSCAVINQCRNVFRFRTMSAASQRSYNPVGDQI